MRIKVSVSAAGGVEEYLFRSVDDLMRSTYEEVEVIDAMGEKVMVLIDAKKVVAAVVDLGISKEVAKAINILVDVNNKIVNG